VDSFTASPIAVLSGRFARNALSAIVSNKFVDNTAPVAKPALDNFIYLSFINGIW